MKRDSKNPTVKPELIDSIINILFTCKQPYKMACYLSYECKLVRTSKYGSIDKQYYNKGLYNKLVIHFNDNQKIFLFFSSKDRQALIYY